MKPIELCAKGIKNSSKEEDVVLDLFLGSGSTLIACEQLNRVCYGMELDEHYCSVIIERYIKLKGSEQVYKLNEDGSKIHIGDL
jgi:site-specific DNA-methyltransferase (adenine-specific)